MKNMLPNGYAGKMGYASAGAHGRLHHRQHGGGGGVGIEDAEGSGRAGAEAGGAVLQGLSRDDATPSPRTRRWPCAVRRRVIDGAELRDHASPFVPSDACIEPACSQLSDNRNALGLLFMLPAARAAAAVPHLSARPRHVARLHRHQDRPRAANGSGSRTSSSCGATRSRGSRSSTRSSTRSSRASSSSRSACGSRCCSTSTCRSRRSCARSCCCRSSCRRRCRRSRSGGSTTRSSRSSAGRCMRMGLIHQLHRFPRRSVERAVLDDRRQHLARRAVRRDHAARRPADDLAVATTRRRASTARRRGSNSAT